MEPRLQMHFYDSLAPKTNLVITLIESFMCNAKKNPTIYFTAFFRKHPASICQCSCRLQLRLRPTNDNVTHMLSERLQIHER